MYTFGMNFFKEVSFIITVLLVNYFNLTFLLTDELAMISIYNWNFSYGILMRKTIGVK